MAAYTALGSLIYILQQIQHHPRPPITIENQHLDSLCEIISFLQDFLENYSHKDIGGCLESQIADAAYAAEDIIESHIVDQILAEKSSSDYNLFYLDLQKVIKDMNLIKKEAIQIQEKIRGINDDQLPTNIISMSANIVGSSTVPPPKRKNTNTNTMVGFDDVLIQIMDRLSGHPPNRQVLPIVGMGGIGKTTLARHAYVYPGIVKHFDIRIWISISQEYMLRDILLQALSFIQRPEIKSEDELGKEFLKDISHHRNHENKSEVELEKEFQVVLYRRQKEEKSSEVELGDQLYKSLWQRRYLVILDDVWSIEALEMLMLFLPDNNNGSRIMITTRMSNVADHFVSCGFNMKFLDEDKSWDLLSKIVFAHDQCFPLELEEIGKKIARNCKGLPLSIVVIGGLLANSEKTQQYWEDIAKNLKSILNSEDDMHCLKILYLSYNHLPIHLKPCFLYMGVFPEDTEIVVSSLIRLWVAEGFLKPIAAKSLEVVAEEYLKDLIGRNLVLVHKWGSSGKVKSCKIHDLLRDLCLREAKEVKFLWVRTEKNLDNLEGIQRQRRIGIHEGASNKKYHIDRVVEALQSASLGRSLTCDLKDVCPLSQTHRLERVLNTVERYIPYELKVKYKNSLKDIFKSVNLRYLAFTMDLNAKLVLPSTIHLLWNLRTLIIRTDDVIIDVPPEIWEMSQLMHLEIGCFSLLDPPNVPLIHEGDNDDFILRNLHTLKKVRNLKLSEEVIERIPNIKNLRLSYFDFLIEGQWHNYCLNNLGHLSKLESLYIDWSFGSNPSFQFEFLENFAFPQWLKKLTLRCIDLLWEDMRMIGSLPHLQILKLKRWSCPGPEWNPVEDEFPCLKFLLIEWCEVLEYWNADSTHFPCLEKLVLRRLSNLKEIPLDVGQISTLQSIELWHCCSSAVMSVQNLLDEQVGEGNEDLEVRVDGEQLFSTGSQQLHSISGSEYPFDSLHFSTSTEWPMTPSQEIKWVDVAIFVISELVIILVAILVFSATPLYFRVLTLLIILLYMTLLSI